MPFYDEDLPFFLMHSPKKGYITFQISHTARTWGGDIEALLSGHIKNLLQPASKIRNYIRAHDDLIALFVGLTFFIIALGASLYTTNIYMNNLLSNSQDLINLSGNDPQTLSDKINHIIKLSASGAWPRYFLYNVCFLFIAVILSISFAVWAGSSADSKEPSFLILTKQSENKKKVIARKSQRSWISFCASIAVSIVCSIIGNIIFISIFGKITF